MSALENTREAHAPAQRGMARAAAAIGPLDLETRLAAADITLPQLLRLRASERQPRISVAA